MYKEETKSAGFTFGIRKELIADFEKAKAHFKSKYGKYTPFMITAFIAEYKRDLKRT